MTAPADRKALELVIGSGLENYYGQPISFAPKVAVDILAAIEAAGCVVVPMEATERMWCAASFASDHDNTPDDVKAILATGIAASPYRAGDGG